MLDTGVIVCTTMLQRISFAFFPIDMVFGLAFFENTAIRIVTSHALVKGNIAFYAMFQAVFVVVEFADGFAFISFVNVIGLLAGIDTFSRDA